MNSLYIYIYIYQFSESPIASYHFRLTMCLSAVLTNQWMLVIVGAINNNLVDYSSKHCIVIADDVCAARYVYLICFILSQCSSSGVLKCFFLLSEG